MGLTHDLNNALGVIRNTAEILRRVRPDDPQIGTILDAAEHAAETCRHIAALSRPSLKAPILFDPNPGIERIARFLASVLGEGIEIHRELDPNVQSILFDPLDLERDIVSLAADARDAMPEGGAITIRTRVDDNAVVVEVLSPGRTQRLRYPVG